MILRRANGRVAIARLLQDRSRPGEGVDHQAVPAYEDFIVQAGQNSLFADGQQLGAAFGQFGLQLPGIAAEQLRFLFDGPREIQDVAALEIADLGHVVNAAERRRPLRRPKRRRFRRGVQT